MLGLKSGKSPELDDIPSELLKNGGGATTSPYSGMTDDPGDEGMPTEWTQSLVIPLLKKGNLKQCQNCRTISLISYPSKFMLRVNLSRLKAKAKELQAEEQSGFRPGRSTAENIFSSRVINEKYLRHQRDLFPNFINFKKAFNRV